MDLYKKQKKVFNTQQLTAFRLLYGWRDRLARDDDESTGYVFSILISVLFCLVMS